MTRMMRRRAEDSLRSLVFLHLEREAQIQEKEGMILLQGTGSTGRTEIEKGTGTLLTETEIVTEEVMIPDIVDVATFQGLLVGDFISQITN